MDRETTRVLMERLRKDADRICERFGLRLGVLEPESPRVRSRYGICYSDGTIRIRLRHAMTGEPLRYSSLVNTLCHELAHLRHMNHGPRFKALYLKILDWARSEGIYRPRAAEAPIVRFETPATLQTAAVAMAAKRRRRAPARVPATQVVAGEAPARGTPARAIVQLELFGS